MTLDSTLAVFLVGAFGAFCGELLHWYALARKGEAPHYAKRVVYWIVTGAMVLVGGVTCIVHFGATADAPVAMNIGAATPVLLQKIVGNLPQEGGARGLAAPSLRGFFGW